jgi:hypothetical protein
MLGFMCLVQLLGLTCKKTSLLRVCVACAVLAVTLRFVFLCYKRKSCVALTLGRKQYLL